MIDANIWPVLTHLLKWLSYIFLMCVYEPVTFSLVIILATIIIFAIVFIKCGKLCGVKNWLNYFKFFARQ